MTEFLFHRNKNTVPIPTGFQLQNFESNYLTQQKPNRALFLFSISNSKRELDSHKQCGRNGRKRNRFPHSFTPAEAGSVPWSCQQDAPPFSAPLPSLFVLWGRTAGYFWRNITELEIYIFFWYHIWQVKLYSRDYLVSGFKLIKTKKFFLSQVFKTIFAPGQLFLSIYTKASWITSAW